MERRIYYITYIFISIILIGINLDVGSSYSQEIIREVVIELNIDGSTNINYKLYIPNPPQDVILNLPDDPIFFTVYVNGSEVPSYYEDGRLYFYADSNDVEIIILSNGLTRKEGFRWIFTIDIQYPFKLILPSNTVILNISINDFSVAVEPDGKLSLLLPKGELSIVYTFPPPEEAAEEPVILPALPSNILPILAILAILAISIIYLFRRRNVMEIEVLEDELDDRDREILNTLKGGMKNAHEIMAETGIPKSPLYRRLKRLENMGYISSVKRGGTKYFYLTKDFN